MKKTNGNDMPPAETKEVKTKVQKALDAKAKYQQLLDDGKAEALETINQAVKELGELGFAYTLIPTEELEALKTAPQTQETASRSVPKAKATPKAKEAPATPSTNYNPDKKCATCQVVGHDQRSHRVRKLKFTETELAELGLMPPDGNLVHSPTG